MSSIRISESDAGSEEELRLRIANSLPSKDGHSDGLSVGKGGFNQPLVIGLMALWYFFSGLNLFANKYIISYLHGDPALLAMGQMLMCTTWGFVQLKYSCGLYTVRSSSTLMTQSQRLRIFQPSMLILGTLRFTTVVMGLVTLNYVAVSFTETVKSSAPLFTVIMSRVLMGEKTGLFVNLSLLPIMIGLALTSATELSFNVPGFVAALCTNLSECMQNVYSKVLMSNERHKYGPAELQFNTASASLMIQIVASFVLLDWTKVWLTTTTWLAVSILVNGTFFHLQSMTEYSLLEHITPVTHSVANTVKRALLIWMSILVFGNAVTLWSGVGTLIVTGGVLLYNRARDWDAQRRQRLVDQPPPKIAL